MIQVFVGNNPIQLGTTLLLDISEPIFVHVGFGREEFDESFDQLLFLLRKSTLESIALRIDTIISLSCRCSSWYLRINDRI